jgi:hypothetical protein
MKENCGQGGETEETKLLADFAMPFKQALVIVGDRM